MFKPFDKINSTIVFSEHLAALGWSKHEYQYVPEPKLRSTSSLFDIWKDVAPWEYEISGKIFRISRQDYTHENKICLYYIIF